MRVRLLLCKSMLTLRGKDDSLENIQSFLEEFIDVLLKPVRWEDQSYGSRLVQVLNEAIFDMSYFQKFT